MGKFDLGPGAEMSVGSIKDMEARLDSEAGKGEDVGAGTEKDQSQSDRLVGESRKAARMIKGERQRGAPLSLAREA